jgi:hypothetical protein
MTITETGEEDTLWGRCERFTGTSYGGGIPVPQVWRTSEPLAGKVLVDRHGMLRQIDIEDVRGPTGA